MKLSDCTCAETGMHLCERHGIKVQENRKARKRPWWSSMSYSSDDHDKEQVWLAGIKADRIFMMNRYDEDGAHCESCGVRVNGTNSELAHWDRRGNSGDNRPDNLGLLCTPALNDCHRRYDNNDLRFTKGS